MAEEQARKGPLLLLDGMSLAFRAYFALPDTLATKSGVVTNAVHGFSSMLVYLIREQRPSAIAVAFDAPGDTFRDEMLEDYKAGRAATPWLLPPQFDIIREVMDSLAIPVIEAPGFEADDVIATLATQAAARDCEVVIVTGDRDSFQLVRDPYIRVLYNKRGVSDYALYDEAGIFERTGVPPEKYVLLASLRGDPSDNLPGVPGVGEKTAAKLLTNYGDLDGVFSHLAELTPKLRENLEANEHLARSNARIIPLVLDVPLQTDVSQLELGGWDPRRAEATFEQYEMRTVWQRLAELLDAGALGEPLAGSVPRSRSRRGRRERTRLGLGLAADARPAPAPLELRDLALPTTPAEAAKLLGELGQGRLAVAGRWNGLPGRSDLVALLLLATEGEEAGLGVLVPGEHLAAAAVVTQLTTLLAQPVVGHNVKELMRSLLPLGIDVTGLEMDTAVAAYLLDASTGEYALQQLREQTGQLTLEIVDAGETAADLAEGGGGGGVRRVRHGRGFRTRITAEDMLVLHDEIETPLVRVLATHGGGRHRRRPRRAAGDRRHAKGVRRRPPGRGARDRRPRVQRELDPAAADGALRRARAQTRQEDQDRLLDRRPDAGEPARRAPHRRRPCCRYREVEKLRSTYGESLLAEVQADGRIHASFGQTVARTGRISSDRPEPAQHPGAQRSRQAVPAGLRAGPGEHVPGGGLRPG